ncbi:unnamed protein product [Acanthoscelides obtectus]|uniref:Uncharacterized protein n=1 Tax=Acanthoscelides obtectus TaxID=200917 RepID=A0A9P0KS18_ACAOB|nr:unnamed protein product [Acanthoscelides obtectus]CAK1646424.1 hypothetical protein AOBTE_LOCUS14624 [Acanthoscelides obtectus]
MLAADYEVICLTETWLKSGVFNNELFTDSYNLYRRDQETTSSNKKDGGGVLIAVKKTLESRRCQQLESDAKHVWISVGPKNSETVFIYCGLFYSLYDV